MTDDLPTPGTGPQPWKHELDALDFDHKGITCMLRRHPVFKHWLGYARMPPEHPHFGSEPNYAVHGGVTFSGQLPDDDGWWVGFDCMHAGDHAPGLQPLIDEAKAKYPEIAELHKLPPHVEELLAKHKETDTYKTIGFAEQQTIRLAEQILASANPTKKAPEPPSRPTE